MNSAYITEPAPYSAQPWTLLSHVQGQKPVLLHSGGHSQTFSRWSFLCYDPYLVFEARDKNVTVTSAQGRSELDGCPFMLLRQTLEQAGFTLSPDQRPVELPFYAGAAGYIGYEAGGYLETLPAKQPGGIGLPDMHFCLYRAAYVLDHQNQAAWITGVDAAAVAGMRELVGKQSAKQQQEFEGLPQTVDRHNFASSVNYAQYCSAIKKTLEYIAAGDIFQANITQRFSAPFTADPMDLFGLLDQVNPAPYSAYLEADDHVILSSSPELFLKTDGRNIITKPIKGTRPRSDDAHKDHQLCAELQLSEKDTAEHVMIVDLERNDLGRVSEYGSVKVQDMKTVESFPRVHHLVSTVSGQVRQGIDAIDILRATFPGGSITGAPKVRAMQIINKLERVPREVYTGAIGYIGMDGQMQFNIAIRTITLKAGSAYFSAGGGIVADSTPEEEYQECLIKAENIMRCITALQEQERSADAVGVL